MVENILPVDPLFRPWVWGQDPTFSEHGHVAHQVKGNDKCSNIQAHILSLHTQLTPGIGSKVKTFFLAYQINGNGG